jgi:hypothetical protein
VTDFVPTAAWAWEPHLASGEGAPARPSVDVEAASIERARGLTAEVLRRYLDRFPEIVGPLRHRPDVFRPLSLRGGRLVACELLGIPEDVPEWRRWLADLEHVQTSSPDVCRALAASVPSFTVNREECVAALRDSAAHVTVAAGPAYSPDAPWCAAPFVDRLAFVPVVSVAQRTWWCWDVDEERPALIAHAEDPDYFLGYGDRVLRPELDVLGPLPHRRAHPPSSLLAHAAAAGDGWACAIHATGRIEPLVVTRPPRQIAIARTVDKRLEHQMDELAWRFVHDPETVFDSDMGSSLVASLATVELLDPSRLRLRWAGAHRLFRLRDGALASLTEPHTMERELRARGLPPDSFPVGMGRMLTRSVGSEPEVIELSMRAGDRFLLCTDETEELFDRDAMRRLLLGDARQSAMEVMHALARAQRNEAALFFTPEASFLHAHSGWLTELDVELEALDRVSWEEPLPNASSHEAQNLYDRPQRFAIHRIAREMETPNPWRSRMWEHGLRAALERFCADRFEPRLHDLFRTWTAGGSVVSMQFDGARWVSVTSSYRPQEGRVTGGLLRFPEDRPTPALEACFARGEHDGMEAEALEGVATREGFVALALWLKLEREHVEGAAGVGLREARDRVSLRVRRRLRQLVFSRRPVVHEVDVPALLKAPTFYDQCRVRYRSHVFELFEGMRTAGAWWEPSDGGSAALDDRSYVADVEVTWRSDGFSGYGHMGMSRALATGTATPYVPPSAPRRVTAEDIRLDRLRAGVPVRAVLELDVDGYHWRWRGRDVDPPPDHGGLDPGARCRVEVDAIVMRLERLTILEVREVLARRDVDG